MIQFTDVAKQKVTAYLEVQQKEGLVLRVQITGKSGRSFTYGFGLDEQKNTRPDDVVVDCGGFTAVIDAQSATSLKGATVDWMESVNGAGFSVENPNSAQDVNNPTFKKIQDLLDHEINPAVAGHGGHVTLIDVQGDRVYLQLGGGCQGCGMVDVTLRQGIEVRIKEILPEIAHVIDTTDHAGGTNPYYAAGK